MGRKIIKKELDKLDIQKKQDEIANSINISKTTNDELKSDNEKLKEEIDLNKKLKFDGDEKVKKLKISIEDNKENYIISNDKLVKISSTLDVTIKEYNKKISDIKILEKDFLFKKEKQEKELDIIKTNSDKKINTLKQENKSLKNTNNDLFSRNNKLKTDNNDLIKIIGINRNKIINQEQNQDRIKGNIQELEVDFELSETRKKVNDDYLEELGTKINNKSEDLKEIEDNLQEKKTELDNIKKEVIKTKESNLVLVKREEKLNSRENYIKQYYEKAGLKF